MPLNGNQDGSSDFQTIDDVNFGVNSSNAMSKPWYHFTGQDDSGEQNRLHSKMRNEHHHQRVLSGEKVTPVATMSPETPSMEANIKRNCTGVNVGALDDQSDSSGRLTLHSVNVSIKNPDPSENMK